MTLTSMKTFLENFLWELQSSLKIYGPNIEKKIVYITQKKSFPLRISSVSVTRSTGNCGFGHIY